MSPRPATSRTFESDIDTDVAVVDFWASWCGPCRSFAPVFEAAAEKYPDVVFLKVDTEAEPELAAQVGIRSIPTLMFFRDGYMVAEQVGAIPEAAFAAALDEVIAMDAADLGADDGETGPFPDGAVV